MLIKPGKDEYNTYYEHYINLVPEGNVLDFFEDQQKSLLGFFSSIDEEKSKFRYAEDKWSIREVLGHVIDGERIFSYRALRISRNDPQPLLSFEQNTYIANSAYNNISFKKIIDEFFLLRASNILMFKGFSNDMWIRKGVVGSNPVSVRAIVYILAGHTEHHINILKERYNC